MLRVLAEISERLNRQDGSSHRESQPLPYLDCRCTPWRGDRRRAVRRLKEELPGHRPALRNDRNDRWRANYLLHSL